MMFKFVGLGSDRLTIDASGNDVDVETDQGDGTRVFNIDGSAFDAINVGIRDLTLTGGDANGDGGAVRSADANLSLTSVSFSSNASLNGGGLAIFASDDLTVSLTYTRFEENVARSVVVDTGSGGGLFAVVENATVEIIDSIFDGNEAEGDGGGLYLQNAGGESERFTLQNSLISGNEARTEEPDGSGGGIWASVGGGDYTYALNSYTVFERNTVRDNTANSSGGGMQLIASGSSSDGSYTRVLVKDCTISGNTAVGADGNGPGENGFSGAGGGIDLSTLAGTRAVIANTTVSTNTAQNGGGMYLRGQSFVRHSTITGNIVDGTSPTEYSRGGGVFLYINPDGSPNEFAKAYFNNTIIAGNVDETDIGLENYDDYSPDVGAALSILGTSSVRLAFTIVGDQSGPIGTGDLEFTDDTVGYINDDALLGPLANNGSLTCSHGIPLLTHLPQGGSPAIGAGDPVYDTGEPVEFGFVSLRYDERGPLFERVFGGRIDIGAVELQPDECFLLGDYNRDDVVDAADYVVWRKTLNYTVPEFEIADGNGNRRIDLDDYEVWRRHFGDVCNDVALPNAPSSQSLNATVVPQREVHQIQSLGALNSTPVHVIESRQGKGAAASGSRTAPHNTLATVDKSVSWLNTATLDAALRDSLPHGRTCELQASESAREFRISPSIEDCMLDLVFESYLWAAIDDAARPAAVLTE